MHEQVNLTQSVLLVFNTYSVIIRLYGMLAEVKLIVV